MYRDFNDYEIIYMISENDNDNFQILFNKYKPLIIKIVSKYQSVFKKYGYDMDDLLQLGYIALYKSLNFYSDNKETRFITYLKNAIKNTLFSEIKMNNTNKKRILNTALSYDKLLDNDLSYLDLLKDPKDMFSYDEEKHNFIYFKNTLDFYNAGIFEMYYNGYTINEISKMFEKTQQQITKLIKNIKKKYQYDILKI